MITDDNFVIAYDDALLGREPKIRVDTLASGLGMDLGYPLTTGCGWSNFRGLSAEEKAQVLVNEAFYMLACGLPLADILREFAKIPCWRNMRDFRMCAGHHRLFIEGRYDELNPHNPE